MLEALACIFPDLLTSYQVMQFLESEQYSSFTRIVFDTAPTVRKMRHSCVISFWRLFLELDGHRLQGHTLRLLSLPDFLDASIGKILKVQNKDLI